MNKVTTMLILALLAASTAQGEVLSKKKSKTEEVAPDSLQLIIQAGDSCMQQYNTLEALKFFQQAFAMKDTADVRMKLSPAWMISCRESGATSSVFDFFFERTSP